jgi:hypothetical protein
MSNSPISVSVNPTVKLLQCTDQESSRYALSAVQIVPILETEQVQIGIDSAGSPVTETQPANRVYAVTCDSKTLVVVQQPGIAADIALLPGSLSGPAKAKHAKTVQLNGQWESQTTHVKTLETTSVTKPVCKGRFPRVQDVLPRLNYTSIVVRLDAKLLANMAAALTNDELKGVDLIIDTVNKDGRVVFSESPIAVCGVNGFGVIMPLGMEGTDGAAEHAEAAVDKYESDRKAFTDNMSRLEKENTAERQAKVLSILNPDLAPTETPVEEIPAEDPAAVAHRAKFDAICAAKNGHGEICLFPVGAEYHAYLNDAEPLAAALELSVSVEYPDTDHELKIATFKQADLAISFNKLARAGLFIHVCNAL